MLKNRVNGVLNRLFPLLAVSGLLLAAWGLVMSPDTPSLGMSQFSGETPAAAPTLLANAHDVNVDAAAESAVQ